ncbi:hypothetical protein L6452_21997 [Arctium lappa]|uniref:Uncharacterized protein n=1 Tax=Arctium lappa TaxID=4217 RepID=A0ACB9AYU6_ARCLA|nr:hypothetical protein L6452_21997 [Arctium lappa]
MEFNQHHNQVYHTTPSSMYTYFSDQAAKEGLWNGTSMGRGSVDIREKIQIELEKERIREQIVAKEIVRMRGLEAESTREVTMHNGGGFPLSLNNRLEPPMEFHDGTGPHHQEIEVLPFQRLPWSPEDNVNYMGKPNGSANWKPPPPTAAAAGSSEPNHCYPEFWNENGSRLHGDLQSWGVQRRSMGMMTKKARQKQKLEIDLLKATRHVS